MNHSETEDLKCDYPSRKLLFQRAQMHRSPLQLISFLQTHVIFPPSHLYPIPCLPSEIVNRWPIQSPSPAEPIHTTDIINVLHKSMRWTLDKANMFSGGTRVNTKCVTLAVMRLDVCECRPECWEWAKDLHDNKNMHSHLQLYCEPYPRDHIIYTTAEKMKKEKKSHDSQRITKIPP